MKKNDKIDVLKEIWANIPKSETEQIPLPPEAIVKKFLNLFHPGEFFYDFFNTQTLSLEYVSPDIEAVLGYAPDELTLSDFLNIMHPDDRDYYISNEKRATEFFGKLPQEKLMKYKFSHDFRIMHKNGTYKRFLVQVIPVHFFTDGGSTNLIGID